MDIITFVAAGVFLGNILTAAFIWSMSRAARYKDEKQIPGLVFMGLLLPLAFMLLAFISAGARLPFLAALGLQ
ncbi:hypothetical protein [Paracoccus sp. SSJ]|uniref:hypothetical protein n=1 Tax=Paracoccus sp. SSJ TaxID=3050636 RepID=UPI00254BFF99|nr:hypothetical protein [Paracoccus sp. SSJ]MDK8874412.1 hypothetical protein [Paracoccus sp. SSJ]